MNTAPQNLRFESIGIAAAILVLAGVLIRWAGSKIRGEITPAKGRRGGAAAMPALDPASQRMIKTALERGIVTSSQLAAMGPAERAFLLSSLKAKLGSDV
jgi:hypothetical protein